MNKFCKTQSVGGERMIYTKLNEINRVAILNTLDNLRVDITTLRDEDRIDYSTYGTMIDDVDSISEALEVEK